MPDALGLMFRIRHWCTRAQQVAIDDHLRFHGLAQITVHRVETRLDQLEALQVAGDRKLLRFAASPAR